MSRDFEGSKVRQLSKSGFMCATDITEIYNKSRVKQGKANKEMKDYFTNKSTNEFIIALCKELNLLENSKGDKCPVWSPESLKIVKRGKDNKGTWLHPYLFIDYAMWLAAEFRAKVVIWVGDNLLHYRNASGDAFKECNNALDKRFDVGRKFWVYANVAQFVAEQVLGSKDKDQWNLATQEQLTHRKELTQKIATIAEYGSFKSVDDLLDNLSKP